MLMRSALLACAAMIASAAAPVMAETPARCAQTTVRVYFQHGSSALDEMAQQTLNAAERNMTDCGYAELRVSVDDANSRAAARGEAIRAAANGRSWDAVRIEPRSSMRSASYRAGPEYAEVTMSPDVLNANAPMARESEAGV